MQKWTEKWTPGENERYRRIVKDVLAFRWGHENEPDWFTAALKEGKAKHDELSSKLEIGTGERVMFAWKGDWIVAHGDKRLEAIHHDVFAEQYEPAPKYSKVA